MDGSSKPKGAFFISLGARVMTPDYIDLVLTTASRECDSCTVFLLDLPESINRTLLLGETVARAEEMVEASCRELREHLRRNWDQEVVTVIKLSEYQHLAIFRKCREAVDQEYKDNQSFARHVHNQIFQNLQPLLNRKGIKNSRDPMMDKLAEYLLLEVSLILAVSSSGIANVEYAPAQARMSLCDGIYDHQYPSLDEFTSKPMRHVSVRPDLKLTGITYQYGEKSFALNDINLHIPAGSRYGIIGKNGSGKTTLLKIIAGHLRPDSGVLHWGAENISDWLAGKRPTSTVFQDYALFPNMNALENVAFGIRHKRGHSKQEAATIARDWLDRLQLDPALHERRPADLSGGEQQRVAIARALAMRPSILLLDEPTAALDTVQREELVSILKNAIQAGSVTSLVVVSHDRDFAFGVCERIAILDGGSLCYEGKLSDVLERPPNAKVAHFLGHFNVFRGTVNDDGLFADEKGEIHLQLEGSRRSAATGKVALVVAHRDVGFESDVEKPELTFDTIVAEVVSLGTHFSVRGTTGSGTAMWLDTTTDPKARIPGTGRCTLAVPCGKSMVVPDNLPAE